MKSSIYVNEKMGALLEKYARHGGQSACITVLMDRYDTLVTVARRGLKTMFLQEEINLMLNNALSTVYEPGAIIPGAVLADTEDEVNAQFEFFGVDRSALINKLRSLDLASQFALADWLEEMKTSTQKA